MTTDAARAPHHADLITRCHLAYLFDRRINPQAAFTTGDQLAHDLRILRQVIEAMCGHSATWACRVNLQRRTADCQRLAHPGLLGKGVIGARHIDQ